MTYLSLKYLFEIEIFQSIPGLYDMLMKTLAIDEPFPSLLRISLGFTQKYGLKPIPLSLKKEGLKGGSGQATRTGWSGFSSS